MKRLMPIFIFAVFFISGCKQTLNSDLVAWWSFEKEDNGQFIDQSSNKIGAINRGAIPVKGKDGKGLYFDGKSVLQIDWTPILDSFPNGITIIAWVKKDTSMFWNTMVSREIGKGWSEYFGLAVNQNKALFSIDTDGKNYQNVIADQTIEPNVWYNLAGTFDNKQFCLFLNGELVQTRAYSSNFQFSDQNPLFIGGNSNDQNNSLVDCFIGTIDEVRIYKRALSEMEIRRLRE